MCVCVGFSNRKGPEPEETDKDMILQEKEAEVSSLPYALRVTSCLFKEALLVSLFYFLLVS